MKTLFQLLMTASFLLIVLDISSCSRQYAHQETVYVRGQFVDAISKRPVGHLKLCIEASGHENCITTSADDEGKFVISLLPSENPDYSLYVQDARYKIVNPHQQVGKQATHQVWYLLPVGANH